MLNVFMFYTPPIFLSCSLQHSSCKHVFSIRVKNSVDPVLMASSGMLRSRKFCQRGSKFDKKKFLADEGIGDPNTTIMGHHWPASKTPLKWHFAGGPMMAQHW